MAQTSKRLFMPSQDECQNVYNAVAKKLWVKMESDGSTQGPLLLRLAFHASGTYDKKTGTGGSNGATMRFSAESGHGDNRGLKIARDFLQSIKEEFPWISYSDLWTLAAVCAVQEMDGPVISWRPGRKDRDASHCSPDGRLPDGAKGAEDLRDTFGRMGFSDKEIVTLSGAHNLGECHKDRSGFEGPWTYATTHFDNKYYKNLMKEKYALRKWDGPQKYNDGEFMMLPTDIALIEDPIFKEQVKIYADDKDVFHKDFADVIVKLFELGVPFTSSENDRMQFKTSEDQGFEYC